MQVICLEEKAFYVLVDSVHDYLKMKFDVKEDKWITAEEAMKKLHIASKTTLQKFRNEGRIKFSQPEKRIILYDRESIEEFLQKKSRNTF